MFLSKFCGYYVQFVCGINLNSRACYFLPVMGPPSPSFKFSHEKSRTVVTAVYLMRWPTVYRPRWLRAFVPHLATFNFLRTPCIKNTQGDTWQSASPGLHLYRYNEISSSGYNEMCRCHYLCARTLHLISDYIWTFWALIGCCRLPRHKCSP